MAALLYLAGGNAGWCDDREKASSIASKPAPEAAIVAYVSEVPYQWQSESGNPLEWWARKLSSEWAQVPEGTNERLRNLRQELSWERLGRTARKGEAEAFVVHGYEFIEYCDSAELDDLLVPMRDGKAAMTGFVILGQRTLANKRGERKFSMIDLEDQEILVDRGGCGELVYRWLDREIRLETGTRTRDQVAEFRTAPSATEAMLAVYFGDAHACVVTSAAYAEVRRYNPEGITSKLVELRASPLLLQHIVACPRRLETPRRKELIKRAAGIRVVQNDGVWTLAVPKPEDLRSLTQLIREWQGFFDAPESLADRNSGTAPAEAAGKPAAEAWLSGRGTP